MKKPNSRTRKGIIIIILWLAFLAVAGLMIYRIEYHLCSEATGEELRREAKSISVLFPVLEENDQFAKEAIDRVMPARMNALAIGLKNSGISKTPDSSSGNSGSLPRLKTWSSMTRGAM